jgi:hypothetical protein
LIGSPVAAPTVIVFCAVTSTGTPGTRALRLIRRSDTDVCVAASPPSPAIVSPSPRPVYPNARGDGTLDAADLETPST